MKPVEVMAGLLQHLKLENSTNDQIIYSLEELESLLTDIDNARDFHTIGGWPILAKYLQSEYPIQQRMKSSWAIGTAIKNSYEYQLWTLETLNNTNTNNITIIELLINQLETNSEDIHYDELNSRVMYAISSASRGNIEVQDKLIESTNFLSKLQSFIQLNNISMNLKRKFWSFISDILTERYYIHTDIKESLENNPNALLQLQNLILFGDYFCQNEWFQLTINSFQSLLLIQSIDTLDLPPTPEHGVFRATLESLLLSLSEITKQSLETIDINGLQIIKNELIILSELKSDSNDQIKQNSIELLYFLN